MKYFKLWVVGLAFVSANVWAAGDISFRIFHLFPEGRFEAGEVLRGGEKENHDQERGAHDVGRAHRRFVERLSIESFEEI